MQLSIEIDEFSSQEILASLVETVVSFHAFHVDLFVLIVKRFAFT